MKLLHRSEGIIALVVVFIMLTIGIVNPAFWALDNIFNILKNNIVIGLMAIGTLLILITGGIDVSAPAFAVAAAYISIKIVLALQLTSAGATIFLAVLIGASFGLLNAFFVAKFQMIPLIVTLATGSMVRGFLLGIVGTSMINIDKMPQSLIALSKIEVFTGIDGTGSRYGLTALLFVYIFVAVCVHFLLKRTMLGRSLYALGGNPISCQRAGFNILTSHVFVYTLAGALAGLAGILHNSLIWLANPRDMVGFEMEVIAAVVLGGASIFGGRGSVFGVMLGVFMFAMVKNSLILMKIDTTWQRVVVGVIIIFATGITAYKDRKKNEQ